MADNPFIDFAFTTEDGTANRTMPARLGDIVNVLEYDADPTGSTNSATAINAAVAVAAAKGDADAGKKGGTVFFPPGLYKVDGSIRNTTIDTTVNLIGSGKYNTVLQGTNNSGFIVQSGINSYFEIQRVEAMSVINLSTTAITGAVRLYLVDGARVADCYLKGTVALDLADNCFNSGAYNCNLVCPDYTDTDSLCCSLGQAGLYGCRLSGGYRGIGLWNGGGTISGCYITGCTIGADLGFCYFNGSSSVVAFAMIGNTLDSNTIGIRAGHAGNAGSGIIAGNLIQGEFGPDGATAPQYGIWNELTDTNAYMGNSVTAECSVAGISCQGNGGGGASFNACTSDIGGGSGAAWLMPNAFPRNYVFINCNNPTTALPLSDWGSASGLEGEEHDITDCNTSTFGATVTGGGSGHRRMRSNGTDWTLAG